MVKIRLKRMGTTKRPVYRLVVADSRSPRDGRFIESIGFYDPLPNPAVVSIEADRVQLWLRRGARPSDSARQLLVKEGILAARPFKITPRVEVEEPATPVPAVSEPAAAVEAETTDTTTEIPVADEPVTAEPTTPEPSAEATTPAQDEADGVAEASPAAPDGAPATTEPAVAEAASE